MEPHPRLDPIERQILLDFPALFPDGDTDDLVNPGRGREAISYAIQHLIGLGLVNASGHEGVHPDAPYFLDAKLTAEGERLRRDLERLWLVRWLEAEWKWLIGTAIALCGVGVLLWNAFHPGAK